MELKEGATVFSADEKEVGKINRFVLNPVSNKVTHFVVEKGLLFPEDKVIPLDWVTGSGEDRVTLSKGAAAVEDLPPFEETNYVQLDDTERQRFAAVPYTYAPTYYWYPPYGAPTYLYPGTMPDVATETERNIPENTVALREGSGVFDTDGDHIGDVERVMVDPNTKRATHFVISQGLLLKERKLVPLEWVRSVMENRVLLAVGSKLIDRLPGYQE